MRRVPFDPVGALAFAAFAYPPNELGFCGPDDSAALLEHGAAGVADAGLATAAAAFDGAWPYLELIAAANDMCDPLDRRVVEAYWIGNGLLDAVTPAALGASLETRFRARAGLSWDRLVTPVGAGAAPHHNFHVFAVYPWLGLLRSGHVDQPLRIIDRCRIRSATVLTVAGGECEVRCRPLVWDGATLKPGPWRREVARCTRDGLGFVPEVAPGDRVALHWDWVCARLDDRRLAALDHYARRQLSAVAASSHPAPAAVLG